MLKIAVFGFYGPDPARILPSEHISPINTGDFMRIVWEMEPVETRVGSGTPDAPCFVKLTGIMDNHPVYVQSLSNRMAPGISYLHCDGYIAIIDAVKILGPKTIQNALRRLADQHPRTHLMIAAGRQNEPDALSSPDIRAALGLHPDLPIYPYVPSEPKTVQRLIRRLVRYISDPNRIPTPIFEGDEIPQGEAVVIEPAVLRVQKPAAPTPPHIQGVGHVSVIVSNLSRSLDFYRGLLGFRVLGHRDVPTNRRGLTITHLDTGRGILELLSYSKSAIDPVIPEGDNPRAGINHLALTVSGLDTIVEQLACAGVPFTLDPTDLVDGVRIAFLTDPDGTEIELMEGNITFTRR